MSKKLQAQIDAIKKSIVNKNLTNTSMATYGKLNEIGQSLYRYDQLSKAGLRDEAKSESTKVNNLVNSFNATEGGTVLKGGISNTRYVWVAEDGACDDCQAMDGTEYDNPDDAPIPLHPNCKCQIEEFYDEEPNETDEEPCDCWDKIDEMVEDANALEDELASDMSDIDSIQNEAEGWLVEAQDLKAQVEHAQEELEATEPCGPDCAITGMAVNITDDKELEDTVYNLIKDIEEARVVYEVFQSNKHEMETTANSFDKYYHAKANCESAELGTIETMWAVVFSIFKEVKDFKTKVFSLHMDAQKVFLDCMNDLRADLYGLMKAKEHGYCSDKLKDIDKVFKK